MVERRVLPVASDTVAAHPPLGLPPVVAGHVHPLSFIVTRYNYYSLWTRKHIRFVGPESGARGLMIFLSITTCRKHAYEKD